MTRSKTINPKDGVTIVDLLGGSTLIIVLSSFLRASAGLADLLLAGALYMLILLLQGQSPVVHHVWIPATILEAAAFVVFLLPIRGGLEIVSIQSVLRYVGRLQEKYSMQLAEGYSEMSWIRFTQGNRSDFLNTSISTAGEAAFFHHLVIELVASCMVVTAMVAAMLYRSPKAAASIGLVVLIGYITNRYFIRSRLRSAGVAKEIAARKLQRMFSDLFLFGKEMRTYSVQRYLYERIERQAQVVTEQSRRLMILPQIMKSFADQGLLFAFAVTVFFVQWKGGNVRALLSLLLYYLVLSRRLLPLIGQISFAISQLEGSYASASIVARELKECRLHRAEVPTPEAPDIGMALQLSGIILHHERTVILRGASLTLKDGEIVLLRGASGSGKTSLLNLVAGVFAPDEGVIRVDRSKIAYVPQEIVLLDASVRENLLFGGLIRDDEMLYEALDVAALGKLVRELPDGLDTRVGDNGVCFSGGERQRLGLARAIARQPKLLLMDEATSALDMSTERRIFENLRRSGITLFVASHRSHDKVASDRQFVLNEGQLIEQECSTENADEAFLLEQVV